MVYPALLECSWNVMAHGDAREKKWRENWRMKRVANTLHATSENGVSGITTADEHTSADSSQLNWRPRPFKWTRPFRRKTKSGFCACAITFQTQSTAPVTLTSTLDKGGWSTPLPGRFTSGKELRCPVWPRMEKKKSLAPNGAQTLGRLETKRTAIPTTLFAIPTVT